MVPTPDEIPRLNRYFLEIPDLIAKKPCNIEAIEKAQKPDNRQPVPGSDARRRPLWTGNKGVLFSTVKQTIFSGKNGEIHAPVLPVYCRKAAMIRVYRPDARWDIHT